MNPTFIESQPHACDEGQKKEPLCTEINLMLMMRIKGKVHRKNMPRIHIELYSASYFDKH